MYKNYLKKLVYLIMLAIMTFGFGSLNASSEMSTGGGVAGGGDMGGTQNDNLNNNPNQQMTRTVTGTIASLSEDRNLMTLQVDGREITVNIVENTEFWDNNNNRINASGLNTNDTVSITGTVNRVDANGMASAMTAEKIMKTQ